MVPLWPPGQVHYSVWLCFLSLLHTGCAQEISAWEFTYRPRAGDSGRDVVDVVEDYLGHPVLPYGQNVTCDPLYTSGKEGVSDSLIYLP